MADRPVRSPAPPLALWLASFPPRGFEPGESIITSATVGTAELSLPPPLTSGSRPRRRNSRAAYITEGLVRGMWHRRPMAPGRASTMLVSGDGRWIGADAFKYGENLFQYVALAHTTAHIVSLDAVCEDAPREVLLDFMASVSMDWCTATTLLTMGAESLSRKTMLLLYDMSRLHPRPELEVRQRDLADILGVARQTLHPVLKQFEERGLLTLGYGEIVISDPMEFIRRLRHRH